MPLAGRGGGRFALVPVIGLAVACGRFGYAPLDGDGGAPDDAANAGDAANAPDGGDPASWWNESFTRRIRLSFTAGASAALADVPVLVRLTPARFDYGAADPQGADLRFVDDDGATLLAHEIDTWSQGGTSWIWVRIPELGAAESGDHVWLYFGNSGAADEQNPAGLWGDRYSGAWHLGEAGGTRSDSTLEANHLAEGGGSVSAEPGQIGDAMVGSGQTYLTLDDASQSGLDLTGAFTLQAWIRPDVDGVAMAVLSKWGSSSDRNYQIRVFASGSIEAAVTDNCTNPQDAQTAAAVPVGAWSHVAATFDGSLFRVYLDGALEAEATLSAGALCAGAAPFEVGSRSGGSSEFQGAIDEVRVSPLERTSEWIEIQHLSTTDSLLQYGAVETVP